MLRACLLLACWAGLAPLGNTAPVVTTALAVVEHALVRRAAAGPMMGGVNFPDPSIIKVDGVWYLFATRTRGNNINIQIATSPDFQTWRLVKNSDGKQKDALPALPAWVLSSSPNTWAPDVKRLSTHRFIMYYSATATADSAKHCVGAAVASSVTGPYRPVGTAALICPLAEGGAIDASGYEEHGRRYIVYKIDGNSLGSGGACNNDSTARHV
ncbi:hypothetical protein LTR53_003151 [Teratosphaeriaceae sp. CCFEE 6253]|nr:hypothetical protein LTR53_003151 [Teratosphaeriaceae sp. CCFEE 6253]